MTDQPAAEPLLRVVKGEPTAEELAAIVGVVAAVAGSEAAAPPAVRRSRWSDPAGRLRGTHRHGPDAWRHSALPR